MGRWVHVYNNQDTDGHDVCSQTKPNQNTPRNKQVLREVGPTGRVVHLAHSGGALLTYLVAKYHLKCVGSCVGGVLHCTYQHRASPRPALSKSMYKSKLMGLSTISPPHPN